MRVLITGAAGFIGFHLARRLLQNGHGVFGFDAVTDYYEVRLKRDRLAQLQALGGFGFDEAPLEDVAALRQAWIAADPEVVVHLAAQAGVRYSLENPRAYVSANLVGTFNVLDMAAGRPPAHLLIASTSSVYGANTAMPYAETHKADLPLTLYAASKKVGEAMSHAYAHLHAMPTTALRFFTVYGPWGRPDMAPFKFVEAIRAGKTIDVYNQGDMSRDFTFVDDLVEGLSRLAACPPAAGQSLGPEDSLSPVAPWRVVNIGAGAPTNLEDFITALERRIGRKAKRRYLPMQPGDAVRTFADTTLLHRLTGYRPTTSLEAGVDALVSWHETYRPGA
ncbi:MAG TPA: NAD-dependent epimerase/dehydratase family protein [Caulobacteraceae bacterium]|nr:NAD-dependent epimerase/dehydratase family protein [Caulobacteraceae bacterium]